MLTTHEGSAMSGEAAPSTVSHVHQNGVVRVVTSIGQSLKMYDQVKLSSCVRNSRKNGEYLIEKISRGIATVFLCNVRCGGQNLTVTSTSTTAPISSPTSTTTKVDTASTTTISTKTSTT